MLITFFFSIMNFALQDRSATSTTDVARERLSTANREFFFENI